MELTPKRDVTRTKLRKTAAAPVEAISGEERATAAQTIALMSGAAGGWEVYFKYTFHRSEGYATLFLGMLPEMSQDSAILAARKRWPTHTRLFMLHKRPQKASANVLKPSEKVYSGGKVLTGDQTAELLENGNRVVNTSVVDPNEPELIED